MKTAFYFLVRLKDDSSCTWIGGALKRSDKNGFVWLTTQAGEKVLELHVSDVTPSTQEAMIQRIKEDALYKDRPDEGPSPPEDPPSKLHRIRD